MFRLANLSLLLLPALSAVVKTCQTCSQQSQRRRFGCRCRSGREREGDAIVPEVTIRIKTKRDVAPVQKVSTQNLKLICPTFVLAGKKWLVGIQFHKAFNLLPVFEEICRILRMKPV